MAAINTFQYVAYTPQGERIQGRVDAPSEQRAEETLWKLSYTIVSLKEVQERGASFLSGGRVKTRDLIVFSRQLATLIESGIPIVRGLQLLQEQIASKRLGRIVGEMIIDLQQGRYLSEAIAKRGGAFPSIYARLIEVGERTGNLELVLRQLAVYLEKEEALVRKIRGAMAYPGFVLTLAIGVVFLMLTVALPPLMGLFESFGAELPLPTRVLLALTGFFSVYKFHILGLIAALIVGAVIVVRTEPGRLLIDTALLRLPLIGRVTIQGAVARMCRSMSTLLQAGLAMPEIIAMSVRTQSNRVIASALEQVRTELLQGHGLAEPLAKRRLFPGMLIQMVRVGEETGALDSNMETLAIFYEEEVDRAVAAMAGAVEPALTMFIGALVGFVALAVIMPMYTLMGAIQ
jgi:type IV pilus assembly protein PilC